MTSRRAIKGAIAVASAVVLLGAGASSASASTVTVGAATPNPAGGGNSFPFSWSTWTPYMGFVYENIPPFNLKTGDVVAFDTGVMNNTDIQLEIAMAGTTANGSNQPAGAFTTVVNNTQVPTNPRGNAIVGDYELQWRAEAPFSFPGGGLLIRFGNPGGAFATDVTPVASLEQGQGTDASGFFVGRFFDSDGVFPWTGVTDTIDVGQFQLTLADAPSSTAPITSPAPVLPPTPGKKKCKKKKHRPAAVAKKCKKHRK
jgi:hypothetical protein